MIYLSKVKEWDFALIGVNTESTAVSPIRDQHLG